MADTTRPPESPFLHIARVPGDQGAVIRCAGVLTVVTGEALRRELGLQASLGQPTLTLNVADCRTLDADGVLLILEIYKRMRVQGRRFVVVSGTGTVAAILRVLGVEGLLPVFPTEAAAELALRGGSPPDPAPVTWAEARAQTLETWRGIRALLEAGPPDEVVRRITSMHGLCRRAEEILQTRSAPGDDRCSLCPLFHLLGGRVEDVGCQSLTQPMLEALFAGDRGAAAMQVDRLIHMTEAMPLPHD